MNKSEIIAKCMAIAQSNYLYVPYVGKPIIASYISGGVETKAAEICHYCSIDVLKKIIDNGCLRFTDIRCLKDTTEFIGIMPIIESVIQNEDYDPRFKKFILNSETLKELKNDNQSYFKFIKEANIPEEKLYCIYTCSLSINGNSNKLWGDYAIDGVNICFDFAWNLFAGRKVTNVNVKQKIDTEISMYKGLIIYNDEEKRNCVKKVFNSLEEIYIEIQDELEDYANYLFYAFKEAINYMRCFFKTKDYRDEEEYRIILKVPKDIIHFHNIRGEIKDIGIYEKDKELKNYIDYKIQKESIKRIAISPFLNMSNADEVRDKINTLCQANNLKQIKIVQTRK